MLLRSCCLYMSCNDLFRMISFWKDLREMTVAILIIEDDQILSNALLKALKQMKRPAKLLSSYQEASVYLNETNNLFNQHPIVLLDISLPDGNGVSLAKIIASKPPIPYIIAISGKASPVEAFRLKELGVKAFLPKPFSIDQFNRELDIAEKSEVEVEETPIVSVLGAMPIKEVTGSVRRTMLINALQQSQGNITTASKILQITRQGVQNMIHEFNLEIEHFKPDKE